MHLYRYFIKNAPPEDPDVEYNLTDQYPLYAFTVDKKLAKRFEQERNMNKFLRFKSKITKEEYKEYVDRNRMQELRLSKLETSTDESETGFVNIAMTYAEYSACDLDMVYIAPYDESFWTGEAHFPPWVYNEEMQKALDAVDYSSIYYAYYPSDDSEETVNGYVNYKPIDAFNYFLEMYSDTFL